MDNGNKTSLRECRFLSEDYFQRLYKAFIEAFSDYVIPFALTETQFRNHINLNAVDINRTAGVIADGRIVGFSLNGFGEWNGKETFYDAGTGVIPNYRRQGLSEAMFEMMVPAFKEKGIRQGLLEVATENTGAIRLYKKLGYRTVRDLALLQCDSRVKRRAASSSRVEVREIETPDWDCLRHFGTASRHGKTRLTQ